jgi:hypothetical protein
MRKQHAPRSGDTKKSKKIDPRLTPEGYAIASPPPPEWLGRIRQLQASLDTFRQGRKLCVVAYRGTSESQVFCDIHRNGIKSAIEPLMCVASYFAGDEKGFLAMAKRAYREFNPEWLSRRGPRNSVAERCYEAISDGLRELGISDGHIVWMDAVTTSVPVYKVNGREERVPLGRLVNMIVKRMPGIKPTTARKYARIWERRTWGGRTSMQDRLSLFHQKRSDKALYSRRPNQ